MWIFFLQTALYECCNLQIFTTSGFDYNELVYENFFHPQVVDITNVLQGNNNIGTRISLTGIVIDVGIIIFTFSFFLLLVTNVADTSYQMHVFWHISYKYGSTSTNNNRFCKML